MKPAFLRSLAVVTFGLAVAAPAFGGEIEIGELIIRTGNRIHVVGPDPSLDLQTLIDDILDASASKRYLVELGPGDYELAADTLVLKPFVDLKGSGQGTTEIVGERSNTGGDCGTDFGVVAATDNTILSDLTVTNDSSAPESATAVCNLSGTSPRIRRLTAGTRAGAGSGNRYGVHLVGGSPKLSDVVIAATGGDLGNPLRCVDATALFSRARITATGGDGHRGIWLVGTCALEMRDTLLTLEGDVVNDGVVVQEGTEIDLSQTRISIVGNVSNTGMVVTGKAVLYDTRIQPEGGAADERGISVVLDGQLRLFRSSVSGDSDALVHNSSKDTIVNQSSLAGDVTVLGMGGTVICVASDDGFGAERAADCSVPP